MSRFSGLLWMFHRKQPFRRGRGTRGLHAWWALGQEGRRLVSAVWVQTWSCWASWFSRPSTIEANLSLLLRSAAIVMAAKILSKLGGEGVGGVKTESRHNTEVNTFIVLLTGHLLTIFQLKHPVSYLPPPVCRWRYLLGQAGVTPASVSPLSISFMRSLFHCCQGDAWQRRDRGCKCGSVVEAKVPRRRASVFCGRAPDRRANAAAEKPN